MAYGSKKGGGRKRSALAAPQTAMKKVIPPRPGRQEDRGGPNPVARAPAEPSMEELADRTHPARRG